MSGLKHPKPLHFSGGSEAASVTQSSGGARKQLPRCRPRTPSLLPAGRHITKAFGSGCRALARAQLERAFLGSWRRIIAPAVLAPCSNGAAGEEVGSEAVARASPRAVLRRGRTCLLPLARGLCSARLLGNLGSGPCVKVLRHPCADSCFI